MPMTVPLDYEIVIIFSEKEAYLYDSTLELFMSPQDYHYFPFKNHSMVAAFIHMNKIDPENGGLCIYPGSHKNGPLEDIGVHQEKDHYGGSIHYMDPVSLTSSFKLSQLVLPYLIR